MGKVFVGHDWAEAHHDVHVEDSQGRRLAKARLPEGVEGVARFHELLGSFVEDPSEVVIATETDRGLFVGALIAAGYGVIAVNPMSTSRYRERHSTSGAKSDPGDARVLAELARTDAHNHRPVAGDSIAAEALKALARAHQSMIWTRQRQTNQLRSTLREFYPGALSCFDDLHGTDAVAVLAVAPTPPLGRSLSRSKIASALRRGGRKRRVEERAAEIQASLRSAQLAAPDVVAKAMGASVAALVAVIAELNAQIARLESELTDRFDKHPDAEIIRSLPGLGTILGAGCSLSSGTTRTAIATPSLARTTPARHPSPKPRASTASCSPATPATGAWPTPATSGPSPPLPPAPVPGPSTTSGVRLATPTTGLYALWPTDSSASSTAASDTGRSTTRTRPGRTESNRPLDAYGPWDV